MPSFKKEGHVTVEGSDSLRSLALELFGSADAWKEIVKLNPNLRSQAGEVRALAIGEHLKLPEGFQPKGAPAVPRSLVSRGPDGRARVRALAPADLEPPPVAPGEGSETAFERALYTWADNLENIVRDLADKVSLLDSQREADQTRLADQGARIIRLELALKEAGAPAAVETPDAESAKV